MKEKQLELLRLESPGFLNAVIIRRDFGFAPLCNLQSHVTFKKDVFFAFL